MFLDKGTTQTQTRFDPTLKLFCRVWHEEFCSRGFVDPEPQPDRGHMTRGHMTPLCSARLHRLKVSDDTEPRTLTVWPTDLLFYLLTYLLIYLFTYLPTYLFTYLPIYLFTYLLSSTAMTFTLSLIGLVKLVNLINLVNLVKKVKLVSK